MTRLLNRADIQGNITRAYGRYSYPFARYFFLHIAETRAGRQFVEDTRGRVTTAVEWAPGQAPQVTLNIGFTYRGLARLGLPTRTLLGFPHEFADGMKARAFILGDRDPTRTETEAAAGDWSRHWDEIWRQNGEADGTDVHVWISMNARAARDGGDRPVPELEQQTGWLRSLCEASGGRVRILPGHGQAGDGEYQEASAIFAEIGGRRVPIPKEHFGFNDGIGDPVFAGQYENPAEERLKVRGRGKWMDPKTGWEPLATGEFLLGHPDEAQEIAPAPQPVNFIQNGSFMAYRKLHQNVASFREVLAAETDRFARMMGVGTEEAGDTLRAKMLGRWPDGMPLSLVPDYGSWREERRKRGFDDPDPLKAMQAERDYLRSAESSDFRYADDLHGIRCPLGSHLRRVNTRDGLDPRNDPAGANPKATTQLNKRRHILRRGLPYGLGPGARTSDETEQGVIFMAICASLFRQFEFVQQQWIEYGLDFNLGNNTCPIAGNHDIHRGHMIPADPRSGKPPYLMSGLKTFVETRGGDYFFLPSMTALAMIAYGVVDPT